MSVYRTCTRLFPGSHLPHLYIGMENLRTNSLSTAQLNFQSANELNRIDPMVLNELGVTYYKRKMYSEAKETFIKALEMSNESESWVKETILCNIGHSYRKAGYDYLTQRYEECHQLLRERPLVEPVGRIPAFCSSIYIPRELSAEQGHPILQQGIDI